MLGLPVGLAVALPSIGAADLFGLLGIGGLATGVAFRDILRNLLAGVLLLLTRPSGLAARSRPAPSREPSRTSRSAPPPSAPSTTGVP
jgi:hypothetical protein